MRPKKPHSARRTAEEMFPLVESYQRGTKDKPGFCQSHRLNIHTFNYWQQKYKAAQEVPTELAGGDKSKFISLGLSSPASMEMMEVCYPNGVRLRLPVGTSLSYLQSLLQLQV